MKHDQLGFATQAIHTGALSLKPYAPLATPIFQTATFLFDSCEQGAQRFAGEAEGYIYTRVGNPTESVLEKRLAALEQGEDALVTASGMGAIAAVLWTYLRAGDHVVAGGTLYGCTFALLSEELPRRGITVSFVDSTDLEAVERAIRPNTRLIYLETPANPNLAVTDIRAVCALAHSWSPEILVTCDNTFASPYHQNPLTLGCDIVMHSATKYLNGHGDVIAGAVISSAERIQEIRLRGVKLLTGCVVSPFDAYLVLRGLKTLELRMQRHSASAALVAAFLKDHPKVERVNYPGLPDFPGHETAARQMCRGFGGMLSFEIKGGRAAGAKLVDSLKLCTLAVSLGDAETLIEHPASMTHSTYPAEELKKFHISEGLVRLSVGLETAEDILWDLDQGLGQI